MTRTFCRLCRGSGWLDCTVTGSDVTGAPIVPYDAVVRCECPNGASFKAATFDQYQDHLQARGRRLERRILPDPTPAQIAARNAAKDAAQHRGTR